MPEKTKRPPVSDAGADATEPTTAAPGQHDGQISRPVILRAALRIVDRDGVDGLSMRRLSDEVGRDPTVLYRHIPNKAALLDGVAEIVLGQLHVDTADPDWAAQLRAVAHDFRRLALEHPNMVPLLVTRPLATPLGQRPPGMLRPLKDVLALLTRAGFAGGDALRIYRVFFGYLSGPASGRRPCGSTSAGDCSPRRAPRGETRRYSDDDLERLKRITELVDQGVNLAGIAHILDLETKTIGVALTRQNHHHSSPTYQTVWGLAEAEGLVLQNDSWVAGVGEHSRW